MTTSPTLTTHYLAETNPRQHAFPLSPSTAEEEMEEKEICQPKSPYSFPFRTMFVSDASHEMAHTLPPFSISRRSLSRRRRWCFNPLLTLLAPALNK
jgi:hypothetical protein